MVKFLGRLFGKAEGGKDDRSAEQPIKRGEYILLDLAMGKRALAGAIMGDLASDKDLAPDLAGCKVNQDERIVLNLWGVTLCVTRGVPNISDQEKRAFLDKYHAYIYLVSSPEGAAEEASFINRLTGLSGTRYQEYFHGFDEMTRRQEAGHRDPSVFSVPGAPLMHAITKNLFGLESDSFLLAVRVQGHVMSQLIAFAKAFGSATGWMTIRRAMEEVE